MVFINPAVARLPQHAHLFGGPGCHKPGSAPGAEGIDCEGGDRVPDAFRPVSGWKNTAEVTKEWEAVFNLTTQTDWTPFPTDK